MWPRITNALLSGWTLRTVSAQGQFGQQIHAVLENAKSGVSTPGGVDLMEALQHLEDELRIRAERPEPQ